MPQRDFSIQAKGLAELRRDLRATDREMLAEVRDTLKDAAGLAATQAAINIRSRTGAIARSYRPFTRGNIAGVRSTHPGAGVQEFGGTISPKGTPITIRPQQAITRAIEQQRDRIVDRLGDGIEEAARRTGWR